MRITVAYNLRIDSSEETAELLTTEDVERIREAIDALGHTVTAVEAEVEYPYFWGYSEETGKGQGEGTNLSSPRDSTRIGRIRSVDSGSTSMTMWRSDEGSRRSVRRRSSARKAVTTSTRSATASTRSSTDSSAISVDTASCSSDEATGD